MAILAAAAVGAVLVVRRVAGSVAQARAGPTASWAQLWTRRLQKAGNDLGRPLGAAETLAEYASSLQRSPLAHPRLEEAVESSPVFSFSGIPLAEEERAVAERVLEELGGRRQRA